MASGTVLQSTNNSTMTLRYSGTDGQAKVIEVPSTSGTMATEEKSLITLGTAQATTSGTFKDFTIPSGVKRITVMFDGVSTNGTSIPIIQLGDSGGIETTSYTASGTTFNSSSPNTGTLFTTGFPTESYNPYVTASGTRYGNIIINNLGGNEWTYHSVIGISLSGSPSSAFMGGSKTLSAELTTVRITTVNGTDAFDAGTVNVSWEF